MFKKTMAFKLTMGFVVIVLISMLTIGVFFIQMFRQYTFDLKEKTMLEKARNISELIGENTMSNGRMFGFGGFIRFLDTMTEADVWITDSKGGPAVFSGMGMGMKQKFSSEPIPDEAKNAIQEVLSGKESVSQSFSSVYKETTLTVGVPVFNSDKNVTGSVFLHAPVTGITQTLNKASSILSVSILIALILAIALGLFYSLMFTRPLKAMNSTALEMANGNYSVRTGISSKDELGQLGSSLDLLASKLGYTIDQLFQEKGKMSDIISSISEGLAAFDLKLKPLSCNNALSDIMNRTQPYKPELLIKDFESMDINSLLFAVIREKTSSHTIKNWMSKKLKFTLSPIINNTGDVTGCVALVQDISESERLEQLRKDFVANVSHEFRTPLTVIKGSLEALIDGAVDKKADIERYYDRMLSETKSLQRLVGDLLELSRLQSGKISINKELIHIPSLLSDVVKSMQTIAIKKDIFIRYTPTKDAPPVFGDYDRLRQLFVIFIDNAVKYSPEKAEIAIGISVGSTMEITIEDHGYGISPEELPYIWDRFYKTDKSRESSGTGLGLAIARHLVQLHDGSVTLQSSIGTGTAVTVNLPLAE
jgi:two-component system sensor histidine kinase ResE